jgi:hypothetical protein
MPLVTDQTRSIDDVLATGCAALDRGAIQDAITFLEQLCPPDRASRLPRPKSEESADVAGQSAAATLTPITLQRFRLDPTRGSSAIIPVGGFGLFLGLATVFIQWPS